ncbi:MAG: phosphoribosylanthranilate isomerase [Campylobacterales bacterium]|nr:phosphoribosylanthranilate isomerase [Campylobacterales bacterium]
MKVKICGITNLDDATIACQAGADALGFVFYEESPRYILPQKAKEIIKNLPPFVKTVGLFVNVKALEADNICTFAGIDIAQIHFEANDEFFRQLQTPYIRVIRAASKEDIEKYKDEYIIVDAYVESYGGEGKRIALDWFDGVDCSKIILAGGLTSENLHELEKYNFYGVDVSSGVEISKGKKDHIKVREFIINAKRL